MKSPRTGRAVGVAASTLLGGPIGFIASIASMAFEGATGQTPTQMVASLVTGTDAPTALAAAPPAADAAAPAQVAQAQPKTPQSTPFALASAAAPLSAKQQNILDLYGASVPSAHTSYRQAQLRPYLKDVTVSKVL